MEHSVVKFLGGSHKVEFPKINLDKPNELVYDLAPEIYHSDRESISSSGLKMVLRSPRAYLAWLLGLDKDDDDDEKDHFRLGRAAHLMILEPKKFSQLYVVEPVFTGKTKDGRDSTMSKEAKEKRAAWRAEQPDDALVLSEEEMQDLTMMAHSLQEHDVARNLLVNGRAEVSGWFSEPETGIRIRIRPDYISSEEGGDYHLCDLKTTRDARVGLFSKQMYQLRYFVQLALYHDGMTIITGRQPASTCFIAVEKKSPYETSVYALDDEGLELGRIWYKHALRVLKKCLETGKWPSSQSAAQMISLPNYADNEPLPEFDFEN